MKVRESLCLALLLPASVCSAAAVVAGAAGEKPAGGAGAAVAGSAPAKGGDKVEITSPQDKISKDDIAAMNKQIQAGLAGSEKEATATVPPARATLKPYYGTEDAPVDGLDGKPHAGPFVDLPPEQAALAKGALSATATAKALPTSLQKLKGEIASIPEKNDGVMDDDARPIPKPGTTGTEGGVSEKEKAKSKQGPLAENTPQEPKSQPPLPHSEQERIREQAEKDGIKLVKDDEPGAKSDQKAGKKSTEYTGGMGIEKPEDLPAKPHDLPHPEGSRSTSGKGRLVDTMPYTEGEKPHQRPAAKPSLREGQSPSGDSFQEWFHSFVVSLTMIIFTEIGDKTFLVAALMAMRHDRLVVFSAAFSALIGMTVLSAVLGHLAPTLLPKRLTTLAAAILFLVFGVRMLREGLAMSKNAGVGEEMREVEAELEEKEQNIAKNVSDKDAEHLLEAGRTGAGSKSGKSSGLANLFSLVLSPAWVQTFIMTFLGEWGDRSQIATIAMAAGQDYWWVTLGAILGHALCTGLAVLGGRALAGKVSMRVVTIGGAIAFLFFGLLYLAECYAEA